MRHKVASPHCMKPVKLVSAISTAGSGNFSGPRFGTELPAQFVDRASQPEVLDSC